MCLIPQDANLRFALSSCEQFSLLLSCCTLQPCRALWSLYGTLWSLRDKVYLVCIHKQEVTDGLKTMLFAIQHDACTTQCSGIDTY